MASRTTITPPVPDVDDRFFWDGIAEGRLLLQRCRRCRRINHPPLAMCGDCQSLEHEAVAAGGSGTVYSWIQSVHPTEPDADPRIVAVVELAEGVRFVANLTGVAMADVTVGMAVEFTVLELDGVALPHFRPVP